MVKKITEENIFPKEFMWGASTASHQVEGNTYNQWTIWELQHAKDQASTAKQRLGWLSNWESIAESATKPENYLSGVGIKHYDMYKGDFDLLQKLQLDSFRFGIEWSRIEPEEGVWNAEALKYYENYIEELLRRGISPVLNIWHWTVPIWFSEKGGFAKKSNVKYFTRFVEKICSELPINKLEYVITLNEPNVYSSFGYITGEWPPNQKNWFKFIAVYSNLAKAHKISYRIIKKCKKTIKIGVAAQLANIQPKRPHDIRDLFVTKWMRYFWNWWFLNKIDSYQDFVGINYYFSDYYTFENKKQWPFFSFRRDNPELPKSELGWYMEPEGLYPLLVRTWNHYKKPIIITENGLADRSDKYRRWWIEETIIAMERALSEGIDLKGYFHWSLLDNFEWAYGWWPKFGLIEVDRTTMKRKLRPSAAWFSEEIKRRRQSKSPQKPS